MNNSIGENFLGSKVLQKIEASKKKVDKNFWEEKAKECGLLLGMRRYSKFKIHPRQQTLCKTMYFYFYTKTNLIENDVQPEPGSHICNELWFSYGSWGTQLR